MATRTDITTGAQTVNAAGAVTGSLDTSALTGDFTIDLVITALAAGKTARIAVEDTANATPFNDALPVALVHVAGPILPHAPVQFSWRAYQLANARRGAANNKLRVNVLACTAAAGLTVQAQIES